MSTIIEATKTFTERALKSELSRRKNNRVRAAEGKPKARAASWVFPALSASDIEEVLQGNIVQVKFKSGRVEFIGLE